LLQYLAERARSANLAFHIKESTWYLTKPSNGSANPDDEDDDGGSSSKSIPYEESALHLGFDVARMSMSDKMFLQSILSRWTGQQDVTLLPREQCNNTAGNPSDSQTNVTLLPRDSPREQCNNTAGNPSDSQKNVTLLPKDSPRDSQQDSQTNVTLLPTDPLSDSHNACPMRYLVLYHAQYLTDESTLQLQEALEQFPTFAILLTTELPVCGRLRDACLEIPVRGLDGDRLLAQYAKAHGLPATDVWQTAVQATLETWSASWSPARVQEVRNWIYLCLQRNLRWTDMIRYWMEAAYACSWMTATQRKEFMGVLWRAESGAGWVLISSYRIPLLWESVHLQIARTLYELRKGNN
jgi:hypothetical protein